MASRESRKGTGYERELVKQAIARGLQAERARGSDGRALGEDKEVDLIVDDFRIQAKRRARVASYLKTTQGVDAVSFREDNGDSLILIPWDRFLDLLVDLREAGSQQHAASS